MELRENQQVIEQIISLPKKSEEEKAREFDLFKENFDLILANEEHIFNTPELFHCYFEKAIIGLAYIGGYHASLGVLIGLWKNNVLIDKCEKCGGKLYIFSAGGSPLSGRNKCSGICGNCKSVSVKSLPSVGPIIKSHKRLKENLNKRKILRTHGQTFQWGKGLTGESVPDEIIEDGVFPANIQELISRLRKR